MSVLGGALAKSLGVLGGPQVATVLVVGGLVVGGLTGGVAGGMLDPGGAATADDTLEIYPCPGSGSPMALAEAGQRMLVTAKDASGDWYRIHFPGAARGEGWVQAEALRLVQPGDALPVADCSEIAVLPPDATPTGTLTAIENNTPSPGPTPEPTATPEPTPSPTAAPTVAPTSTPRPTPRSTSTPAPSPTPIIPTLPPPPTFVPSPSPSPTPDTTGPVLSNLQASSSGITYCQTAQIQVTAADPSGVASVTLWIDPPGPTGWQALSMTRVSGTPTNGTWRVTLVPDGSWNTVGPLYYYTVGTDTVGNSQQFPLPGMVGYPSIYLYACIG